MQTVSALPEQARRRGLAVLLGTSFFTWGGFFAVIPLITVHYVDQLGWTAASVGSVLAIRQFLQIEGTRSHWEWTPQEVRRRLDDLGVDAPEDE